MVPSVEPFQRMDHGSIVAMRRIDLHGSMRFRQSIVVVPKTMSNRYCCTGTDTDTTAAATTATTTTTTTTTMKSRFDTRVHGHLEYVERQVGFPARSEMELIVGRRQPTAHPRVMSFGQRSRLLRRLDKLKGFDFDLWLER